jgi:hypothetical protein
MTAIFLFMIFLPVVLPSGTVVAQTTGSIQKVDHQVEVIYSGQVVIRDTIYVYGQVADGFMIGLPSRYSAYILKAICYDADNVYQTNLGVQLGDRSGFYGAEINFNGKSPTVFTVAFVLSNSLVTYASDTSFYTLDFPAYPSLTQNAATCNVTVTLPSIPTSITITKTDGKTEADNYITQNLPAYTYSIGSATFKIPAGTIQSTDVSHLNRQITIDPSGKITSSDSYHITNNSTLTMTSFPLNLPPNASQIVVKDEFGRTLTTATSYVTSRDVLLSNSTLITFLTSGQSTTITANYDLPGATIQGSHYTLSDFKLFPNFYYFVDHATFTFTPPEGATVMTPQLSSLDSSATLTRDTFQDTLTVTRDGISYLDYSIPESNAVQLSIDYNPVWVSFRPTFWLSFLAVIGCVAVAFVRRRKPGEKETTIAVAEQPQTQQQITTTPSPQTKRAEPITAQRITSESIREFTDAYEEKKQLNAELKSLDARAQKGKIPRRQYKVQRRAMEVRLETLTRNTNRIKETFRTSASLYSDLVKQLDAAETDLNEAEENIKKLELRQSRGEISIEAYKKNIGDYQKRKEKAESTISGILLRLREKAR